MFGVFEGLLIVMFYGGLLLGLGALAWGVISTFILFKR